MFLNKAPRILKIAAFLILLTVLAFFIIIIYNLASYLQLHSLISGRIQVFQEITYRDQNMRVALLDLKIMQSVAQNITLYNNSTVLPNGTDRMTFYQNDLLLSMTKVKEYTDAFKQFINMN